MNTNAQNFTDINDITTASLGWLDTCLPIIEDQNDLRSIRNNHQDYQPLSAASSVPSPKLQLKSNTAPPSTNRKSGTATRKTKSALPKRKASQDLQNSIFYTQLDNKSCIKSQSKMATTDDARLTMHSYTGQVGTWHREQLHFSEAARVPLPGGAAIVKVAGQSKQPRFVFRFHVGLVGKYRGSKEVR